MWGMNEGIFVISILMNVNFNIFSRIFKSKIWDISRISQTHITINFYINITNFHMFKLPSTI